MMNAVSVVKILLFYGRFYHMMKSTMNMVKGVGIGMLAGAAVTVVGSQMMKADKKHLKKSAGKAMKTVSDVLDNVQYMFK